jgi:hypothetical protein
MVTAIRETVTVKAGGVIEVRSPALREGDRADVIVLVEQAPAAAAAQPLTSPPPATMLELVDSLPPGPRSAATWDEVERNFREEREAWDRRP